MRLILRGDKLSAKKYIGFAKARLSDMKNIMNALSINYNRKYYKLPDAELVVESKYGLDSAWIVGKRIIIDANLSLIATLPIISLESYTIHSHRVETWLNSSGGTVSYQAVIWDSNGNALWTGTSTALFVSALIKISIPVSDTIFSSSETYYYGIEFDYVSGQPILLYQATLAPPGHTIYIWNSGTSSWDVINAQLQLYFRKYKRVSPTGYTDAFVGQKIGTLSGFQTVASSSVATTTFTTAVTPGTIITGFEPVTTLLG